MSRYVARRVLQMLLALVGTTFVVYALMFGIADDPIRALAGEKPLSPSQRAQLIEQYKLDRPFLTQYGYFLKGLATGNLGKTIAGRPIADVLIESWPRTLRLGLMATVFVVVFGISGGVVAGLWRRGLR